MNRNKKGRMPEITRDVYKAVKKFDRHQFTEFCKDLYGYGYEDGFEDGKNAVPGVDVEKIYGVVAAVKGIGPKRLAMVKENIVAAFGGQVVQNE